MHHWEWVAPVSTLLLGIAGLYFTRRVSRDGQKHAEILADGQRGHAEKLSRETRAADAYLRALTVAEQVGYWVQTTRPLLDDGSGPDLQLPTSEEQAMAKAALQGFGAQAVIDVWDTWYGTAVRFLSSDRVLRAMEQAGERDATYFAGLIEIQQLKPIEVAQRLAIGQSVASVLGHREAEAAVLSEIAA
jgi:hypothetical protein